MFATTSFCKVKHGSYFCKICHYISTTARYIELWSFHQLRNLMVESDGSLQGAQMDGAIYEAGLFADNRYILCWTPYQSNKLLWTLNLKKKSFFSGKKKKQNRKPQQLVLWLQVWALFLNLWDLNILPDSSIYWLHGKGRIGFSHPSVWRGWERAALLPAESQARGHSVVLVCHTPRVPVVCPCRKWPSGSRVVSS